MLVGVVTLPPSLISVLWNIGILLHKQDTQAKHFDGKCTYNKFTILELKNRKGTKTFWPAVYKIAITLFCCVTQLFVQRSTTQMSSDINKYNAPESQVDF